MTRGRVLVFAVALCACAGQLVLAASIVAPALAIAQAPERGLVAVTPIDGAGGDDARSALIRELTRSGIRAEARAAATTTDAAATIEGNLRRRGRRRTLSVVARAADGRELGSWSATRRSPDDLAPALVGRLADALHAALDAPTEPAPPGERTGPRPYRFGDAPTRDAPAEHVTREPLRDSRDEPARSHGSARPVPFEIVAGFRLRSRDLSYTDDLFAELSGYELAPAPVLFAQTTFFPGALATPGAAAHIGIEARAEVGVGISSTASDGTEHGTRFQALSVDAVVRLPFGAIEIRPHAGWGMHAFTFDSASSGQTPVPDVAYQHLVLGTSVLVHAASALDVHARFSWLPVLSMGEIGDSEWFPRASAGGIDGEIGATVHVTGGFGIRVAGEIRRFFFRMSPEPGDARIAGGAIDQHLGGSIALQWRVR